MPHGIFALRQICEGKYKSLLATKELACLDNQFVQRGQLPICVLL